MFILYGVCVAFIPERRLLEGGVYLRKNGILVSIKVGTQTNYKIIAIQWTGNHTCSTQKQVWSMGRAFLLNLLAFEMPDQ